MTSFLQKQLLIKAIQDVREPIVAKYLNEKRRFDTTEEAQHWLQQFCSVSVISNSDLDVKHSNYAWCGLIWGSETQPPILAALSRTDDIPTDDINSGKVKIFGAGGLKDHWKSVVSPTHAEKIAGNYKKKHIKFQGMNISIENEKGSTRSGTDRFGKSWSVTMRNDYGYVKRTVGVDGDHVDVYLGPNESAVNVYVVHQIVPATGKYDEDKCMLGFATEEAAKKAYLRHYANPKFLGHISTVPVSLFKEKIFSSKNEPIVPDAAELVKKHQPGKHNQKLHGSSTKSKLLYKNNKYSHGVYGIPVKTGSEIYEIITLSTDAVFPQGKIVVSTTNNRVYFAEASALDGAGHDEIISKIPGAVYDDFVRMEVDFDEDNKMFISAEVQTAGISIPDDANVGDAIVSSAIDNIYKAFESLVDLGISKNTPAVITTHWAMDSLEDFEPVIGTLKSLVEKHQPGKHNQKAHASRAASANRTQIQDSHNVADTDYNYSPPAKIAIGSGERMFLNASNLAKQELADKGVTEQDPTYSSQHLDSTINKLVNQGDGKPKIASNILDGVKSTERATSWLKSAIRTSVKPAVVALKDGDMSNCSPEALNLAANATNHGQSLTHEYGHWLSYHDPETFKATDSFLKSRAGPKIKIKGYGGAANDDAYSDTFMSAAVGKIYAHGANEVLSIGMQNMYAQPKAFLKTDPDHFFLTLSLMNSGMSTKSLTDLEYDYLPYQEIDDEETCS